MEQRRLGRTGLVVSTLGFGSAPLGFLNLPGSKAARLLNDALDAGVNLFDTAAAYPGSEEAIGAALAHRREKCVLVSKCGRPGSPETDDSWTASSIAASIDQSLKRLQTDFLDVVLLHSCDVAVLRGSEALGALVKAQEAGKVRHLGYSGDNEAAAAAAQLPEVEVVEISISICDQINLDAVLPIATRNDVGVIAKRPLANAAWKKLDQQPGMYRDYAASYTRRLRSMAVTPAQLGFDGDANEQWPEIALRFVLSEPLVSTAVVGTTNRGHLTENIAIAGQGPLHPEAVKSLRAAFARGEATAMQSWRALT
jgi:aryl-alcohol dehydrogenase-like predicted oxidoreductase